MKWQITKYLALTLLPPLFWLIAVLLRPSIIELKCAQSPQPCTKASVLKIDQLSLGMEDSQADEYSYITQNFSGIFAAVAPVTWNASLFAIGKVSLPVALVTTGNELTVLLRTVGWNGFLTETSHLISQRPRPFVYSDPAQRGTDPAHYTSFYSGHTSFTAATTVGIFLLLFNRNAPWFLLLMAGVMSEALVFSTAYFRILAGRHFLTDVICGAIAGSLVALITAHFHKKKL
jgi:membrane-associated phospholipid phosphatase